MFKRRNVRVPVLAIGALFALAACGGGSEESSAEVASLQGAVDAGGDAADAAVRTEAAPDLAPDEAALEFSQCMRDQGIDFPDLSIDADGNIELREAFQTIDRQADGFREANEVCQEFLQQAGFGGGRRAATESPELQDALLEFSQCVRDAGYDVGDLTLGGPGGGQGAGAGAAAGQGNQGGDGDAAGEGGQGQGGRRQQGFGNRSANFANQLGLDAEDPAVQETIDGCMPLIDEAFTALGIGQPAGN